MRGGTTFTKGRTAHNNLDLLGKHLREYLPLLLELCIG